MNAKPQNGVIFSKRPMFYQKLKHIENPVEAGFITKQEEYFSSSTVYLKIKCLDGLSCIRNTL